MNRYKDVKGQHYWIVLLDNGHFKEIYGTYDFVISWLAERDNYNQGYRLALWDN